MYMLWLNLILSANFIFYVIFLVILMYVNEFKTKGKIAPRIRKLNHITDINVAIS